jgi:hypothetical protein
MKCRQLKIQLPGFLILNKPLLQPLSPPLRNGNPSPTSKHQPLPHPHLHPPQVHQMRLVYPAKKLPRQHRLHLLQPLAERKILAVCQENRCIIASRFASNDVGAPGYPVAVLHREGNRFTGMVRWRFHCVFGWRSCIGVLFYYMDEGIGTSYCQQPALSGFVNEKIVIVTVFFMGFY